ncbi:uroporphyrinogen-III synthase [gamma proteobacterium HTCC5015]|nr:uroporphyrinogen-III synthase [gamma proteobacterium HTCC5015]
MSDGLKTLRVALPETRQLDALARLLEHRGADVQRCPLVSIHDSPEREKVEAWLDRFIEQPPSVLVILTGEGIRRLTGFAERSGRLAAWQQALGQTLKLARGPKPGKALRELGLRSDVLADRPTTEGVIETLKQHSLKGQRVGVQLYGTNPNTPLMAYLAEREAEVDTVAPYVYASELESEAVEQLILDLASGEYDLLCFTSQPQLKRLHQVAHKSGLEAELAAGLKETALAAIGPVMAGVLNAEGYSVAVQPQKHFFMGDLVSAIEAWWQAPP